MPEHEGPKVIPFPDRAHDALREEYEREWLKNNLDWALRNLAANMIRVVRGAGKSYEIGPQCVKVIEAMQEYREGFGVYPSSFDLEQALKIEPDRENEVYDDAYEQEVARWRMIRGSLQVAASRLVGQNTQEQRGRSELMDGFDSLYRLREEARNRRLEVEKAARQAARAKPSTKKKPGRKKPPVRL